MGLEAHLSTPARGEFADPALDDVQLGVLDAMRRDGIAIVPFRDLFRDQPLWEGLTDDIGQFVEATEARLPELRARDDAKAYIVRRFQKSKQPFLLDDRWLQLGLSSRILDVVNAYRGGFMKLVSFDNWYTIPDAGTDNRIASQRWHRDPWDNHIVKVFVYFSDVGEDAGPFEYLRGSPAGGRYGHLWPWVDAREDGIYPPQEELAPAVAAEDFLTVTGPAGTAIFCDTSGFHRGGWARTSPRILSYHTYVAPGATRPRFRLDWSGDGADMPEPALFAIS